MWTSSGGNRLKNRVKRSIKSHGSGVRAGGGAAKKRRSSRPRESWMDKFSYVPGSAGGGSAGPAAGAGGGAASLAPAQAASTRGSTQWHGAEAENVEPNRRGARSSLSYGSDAADDDGEGDGMSLMEVDGQESLDDHLLEPMTLTLKKREAAEDRDANDVGLGELIVGRARQQGPAAKLGTHATAGAPPQMRTLHPLLKKKFRTRGDGSEVQVEVEAGAGTAHGGRAGGRIACPPGSRGRGGGAASFGVEHGCHGPALDGPARHADTHDDGDGDGTDDGSAEGDDVFSFSRKLKQHRREQQQHQHQHQHQQEEGRRAMGMGMETAKDDDVESVTSLFEVPEAEPRLCHSPTLHEDFFTDDADDAQHGILFINDNELLHGGAGPATTIATATATAAAAVTAKETATTADNPGATSAAVASAARAADSATEAKLRNLLQVFRSAQPQKDVFAALDVMEIVDFLCLHKKNALALQALFAMTETPSVAWTPKGAEYGLENVRRAFPDFPRLVDTFATLSKQQAPLTK